MKRYFTCLCLTFILTACTPAGQSAPAVNPVTALESPTVTPEPAQGVPLAVRNLQQNGYEIQVVDPATGLAVTGYAPFDLGKNGVSEMQSITSAYSEDGKKLAIVAYNGETCDAYADGTRCRPGGGQLYLIDVPAWHQLASIPVDGWIGSITFSPDDSSLAFVSTEQTRNTLFVAGTNSGEIRVQRALDFTPALMVYIPDGSGLAVYSQPAGTDPGISKPGPVRVLVLEAATLKTAWEQALGDITSGEWCQENCSASHEQQTFVEWGPAVVLSRDRQKLYIVHADEEKLTTIDFGARTVSSIEIRASQSWLERLLAWTAGVAQAKGRSNGAVKTAALSPDGTRLYLLVQTISANTDQANETADLQVIELNGGQTLTSEQVGQASGIQLAQDGNLLLLDGWDPSGHWVQVLDARSLEVVADLKGWLVTPTRRMDGKEIIVADWPNGDTTKLALLDPQSFEIVNSWSLETDASWITGQ